MSSIGVYFSLDRLSAAAGFSDNFDNLVNSANAVDLLNAAGQIIATLSSLNPVTSIPGNAFGGTITGGKILSDLQKDGEMSVGDLVSVLGNAVAITGTVAGLVATSPILVVGASVGGTLLGVGGLGIGIWDRMHPDDQVRIKFDSSRLWVAPPPSRSPCSRP